MEQDVVNFIETHTSELRIENFLLPSERKWDGRGLGVEKNTDAISCHTFGRGKGRHLVRYITLSNRTIDPNHRD